MRRKLAAFVSVLAAVCLMLGTVTGCTGLKKQDGTAQSGSGEKAQSIAADKGKVFKSADGKVQLTAGNDWKQDDQLNSEAGLQISNRIAEKYVIVISETKDNFAADMKLEDYYNIISDNMKQAVTSSTFQGPVDVTVNGSPAKQFEVHGEVDKTKVGYIVTVVETGTGFHQIISWTLENKFEKHKDELMEVSRSFTELA